MHETLKKGAPDGSKFACNPSGYMNSDIFIEWFDHFIENVKPTENDPVLLIIDGHSSHTKNLTFADKAKANHVTVLVLPPHCSHKMQPLDVAFMNPFKTYYAAACESFMKLHPGRAIGQYDVAELIGIAFTKAATMNVAVNGFKTTGIWPMDRFIFKDEDFGPSEVTEKPMLNETEPETSTTCASPTHDVAENVLREEQPCEASPNSSFSVPPTQIVPLPKAAEVVTGTKRKRKAGKAVDVTSDSYRQDLAVAEAVKQIKSIKSRRTNTARKPRKTKNLGNDSVDVLCELCGSSFSDSLDGQGWKKCLKCLGWFHIQCAEVSINNLCRSCV